MPTMNPNRGDFRFLDRLARALGRSRPATGRLLAHAPGVARIGRMATLTSVRGAGLGRAVLDALLAAARQRGERTVLLHANGTAVPFYERAGFSCSGAVYEEAGLPHQEMRRAL
jgi:predicted GNAT family N-acyltransferase